MPLTIASEEVDQLAERLASQAGVSKAEAVRIALVNELAEREKGSSGSVPPHTRHSGAAKRSPESRAATECV